jgi:hypothetical protein
MKEVHFFETQRHILIYTVVKASKLAGYCGFPLSMRANARMVCQSGHDDLLSRLIQIYMSRLEII